jgi:hypothetical protein
MTTRRALAEIAVDPERGWVLPRFGGQPFRYQAWAHFEKDPTWGSATWTLLVELADAPAPSTDKVEATVSFVAPGAPHAVLEEGASFELFMGQVHYTHGHITRILPDDNAA